MVSNAITLGFMVSETKSAGNFKVESSHTDRHVADIIRQVFYERLGNIVPDYFLSDSAPVNTLAVRLHMIENGNEPWYPYSVHFVHLAVRDATRCYLGASLTNSQECEKMKIGMG